MRYDIRYLVKETKDDQWYPSHLKAIPQPKSRYDNPSPRYCVISCLSKRQKTFKTAREQKIAISKLCTKGDFRSASQALQHISVLDNFMDGQNS